MHRTARAPIARSIDSAPARPTPAEARFDQIYAEYFDFVWRSLRRLGVHEARLADAAQNVFLVVHRRLPEFEGRSSIKTWVFAITIRVARDDQRMQKRKPLHARGECPKDPDALVDPSAVDPERCAQQMDAIRLLELLVEEITEERREVFLLAELEEWSGPEIAEALGLDLGTVYHRLRAGRREFEQALARHRAREARMRP